MAINMNELHEKMEEHSMTQSKLASLLGVSKSTMSRKINGKSDFSVSQAFKVCHILNIESPQSIFLP